MDSFDQIRQEIIQHPMNKVFTDQETFPLYTASSHAQILIIGQAPGHQAQESQIVRNDKSGDTLRSWLGVSKEEFYQTELIALLPMDFYYPGKGEHGDLPPRKDFASYRHPRLLTLMPEIQLTLLIGKYAQDFYLKSYKKKNLTETVRSYQEYLPDFFPLVHPSPLNFRRQAKNPRFLKEVIPELQRLVAQIKNS